MRAHSLMRPASDVRGIRPLPTPLDLNGCIISDLSAILPASFSMLFNRLGHLSCRYFHDDARSRVPSYRLQCWHVPRASPWLSHLLCLRAPLSPDVVGETFGQGP